MQSRGTERGGPGLRSTGPSAARFGLLKGFGLSPRGRAAGDGDDVVLNGGYLSPHARPDADGEALVGGLSYLLLVLHFVALGDERRGRRQKTAAQGQVHTRDPADKSDDALSGWLGLYAGVLLALPVPGDQEEGVRHPPHVGVARPQLLDAYVVQVRSAVQNGEVARVLE